MSTLKTTNIVHPSATSNNIVLDSSSRVLVGTSTAPTGTNSQYAKGVIQGNTFNASGTGRFVLQSGSAAGSLSSGSSIGDIFFADNGAGEYARIACEVDATPGTNDYPGRLVFSTTKDGASSPSERMRIDNLGRICINQTSATDFGAVNVTYNSDDPSNQPATGVNITQSNANTGTMMGFRNSAGTVIGTINNNNNGTITYVSTSDYRLKENIVDLDSAIDRLQAIPVHRFNFIGFPGKTVDGFVAHEIQDVVPEAVTGEKDAEDADGNPIYQGIDQSKLVPLLTAALQEAIAKIETLEARLTALESA